MSEEKQINPKLSLGDIEINGAPLKIKLDCAEAVKEGQSKFGTWYMWFGLVENAPKVMAGGKGEPQTEIKNYTGKVIFFPSALLNTELKKLSNGKVGAVVNIYQKVEKGKKGLITKYKVEKLSDGEGQAEDSLAPGESKLLNDAKSMMRQGMKLSEMEFIKASQEAVYGGQISSIRAKELYSFLTR